jgi:hypothetical protein
VSWVFSDADVLQKTILSTDFPNYVKGELCHYIFAINPTDSTAQGKSSAAPRVRSWAQAYSIPMVSCMSSNRTPSRYLIAIYLQAICGSKAIFD